MNYYNPIGVVALPQGRGFNRDSFLRHVRESNMKCAVVLDDLQLCKDLHIPYPIYRSYTFEPNPGNSPETALASAKNAVNFIASQPGYSEVIWHINNEPDVTNLRFNMYAFMMEEIGDRKLPIRCVFGNFASGSVRCGQGTDENEWITKAEMFLFSLETYTQHFIGVHEYTSYYPWYVSDGGKYMSNTTWKNRPTKLDWSLPQWHLGRNSQGIAEACAHHGVKLPRMLVTEALIDRMNDVVRERELNGYKTYRDRWAVQFPEYSLGELYSEFLIWAWETIYVQSPVPVEAVATFCYGNTGNWDNYDVAPDPAYLRGMEEYRYAPPEAPVPQPAPDISNPKEMRIRMPSDFVNLRRNADVLSDVLLTIPKDSQVTLFPNSTRNGWIGLRYDNLMGWVSLQAGKVFFEAVTSPTPPPSEAELRLQAIMEAFWIFNATFESLQKDLAELKELLSDGTTKL